jgi:CheY-like chemotaxis protein
MSDAAGPSVGEFTCAYVCREEREVFKDATDGTRRGERALKDARIMLVEDDFIVAFDMQSLLEDYGARVLGPATSVREARELIDSQTPDVAVLDVNLNGEWVFPLAEILHERGVPFVFATAYADDDHLFPVSLRTVPRLAKPVVPDALIAQIERLLGGVDG